MSLKSKIETGAELVSGGFDRAADEFRNVIMMLHGAGLGFVLEFPCTFLEKEVTDFYIHLKVRREGRVLKSKVNSIKVKVTPALLNRHLCLPDPLEAQEVTQADWYRSLAFCGHPPVKKAVKRTFMNGPGKLLADIIGKVFLCKTKSHDYIGEDMFLLMAAVISNRRLNWGRVLFERLKASQHSPSFGRILSLYFSQFDLHGFNLGFGKKLHHSKKIDSSLIDRWGRQFQRRAPAPVGDDDDEDDDDDDDEGENAADEDADDDDDDDGGAAFGAGTSGTQVSPPTSPAFQPPQSVQPEPQPSPKSPVQSEPSAPTEPAQQAASPVAEGEHPGILDQDRVSPIPATSSASDSSYHPSPEEESSSPVSAHPSSHSSLPPGYSEFAHLNEEEPTAELQPSPLADAIEKFYAQVPLLAAPPSTSAKGKAPMSQSSHHTPAAPLLPPPDSVYSSLKIHPEQSVRHSPEEPAVTSENSSLALIIQLLQEQRAHFDTELHNVHQRIDSSEQLISNQIATMQHRMDEFRTQMDEWLTTAGTALDHHNQLAGLSLERVHDIHIRSTTIDENVTTLRTEVGLLSDNIQHQFLTDKAEIIASIIEEVKKGEDHIWDSINEVHRDVHYKFQKLHDHTHNTAQWLLDNLSRPASPSGEPLPKRRKLDFDQGESSSQPNPTVPEQSLPLKEFKEKWSDAEKKIILGTLRHVEEHNEDPLKYYSPEEWRKYKASKWDITCHFQKYGARAKEFPIPEKYHPKPKAYFELKKEQELQIKRERQAAKSKSDKEWEKTMKEGAEKRKERGNQ